jgi:AraC-like DNA-binding protein
MYQLHPPAPALASLIEHYWAVTPDDGPVDLRVDVFVDGRADLLFNFGAPYTRVVLGGDTAEHSASNLDAQRTVPIRIVQRGHVRIVGVRFRLGGLGAFVRAPLAPFTNQTPAPDAVFGEGARALEVGLGAAADLPEAAGQLDTFFLARLVRDDTRGAFERALGRLVATDGRAPVNEVAAEVGVSARHLDRLFARQLGIPPKAVGRILRFQGALRSLMRDPGCPLADVALAAGYFDQAHFIRDFRVMTGGVPRGYRGYYPPDAPTHFAPNVVVFVQDGARRR